MANASLPTVSPVSAANDISSIFVKNQAGGVRQVSPGLLATALGVSSSSASNATAHGDTRNPTAADDSASGYVKDQFWVNESTGKVFVARSVTQGAAIWIAVGSDHIGYLPNNTYYPKYMKIKSGAPDAVQPPGAGRHMFHYGYIHERVTISTFNFKVTTAVAGTLGQVGVYRIDPTTKRPIGSPIGQTADIDLGSLGTKSGAPTSTLQLDIGAYAFDVVFNVATTSASTLIACDSGDCAAAYQNWGTPTVANSFGSFYGLRYDGAYGSFPNFGSGQAFVDQFSAFPVTNFTVASVP